MAHLDKKQTVWEQTPLYDGYQGLSVTFVIVLDGPKGVAHVRTELRTLTHEPGLLALTGVQVEGRPSSPQLLQRLRDTLEEAERLLLPF